MEKYIVDRFEGSFAVCEKQDGSFVNIEKNKLPSGCEEGSCVLCSGGKYTLDEDETLNRRQKMQSLFDSLRK